MWFKAFFSEIYKHLVKINDSNQKVALGIAVGVFFGIIPGAGLIISLLAASLLRVNKAAALLGCLVTNTWISLVTAILAVKIGAFIFKISWQELWQVSLNLIRNFNFSDFFNLAILRILTPVFTGYIIISFCFALVSYLISLAAIKQARQKKEKK